MSNEDRQSDEQQVVDESRARPEHVLCPHCGERHAHEEADRCPVCCGDLRAVESLREHAWRHHDDRVDMADFERWLAGEIEIAGLTSGARVRQTDERQTRVEGQHAGRPMERGVEGVPHSSREVPAEVWREENAPSYDTPPYGDSATPGFPATGSGGEPMQAVAPAEDLADDDSRDASDRDDERWPPQFSPGLRINFRAQPIDGAPDASGTSPQRSRGHEQEDQTYESRERSQPRDEGSRGKPPVLIVDGPGPVVFAGRSARSVILTSEQLVIGRSSRDGRVRVDLDLSAYHKYDRLIARRHARLYFDRGLWFIEDFADNDATFLYGRAKPLNLETVPLRDGDKILIGDSVRFRFHAR